MSNMVLDQGILKVKPVHGRQTKLQTRQTAGLPLNRIKRLMDNHQPHVCIIRGLGGIGDVLMTTPAIRALRRELPNAKITYATDFKYLNGSLTEILKHNPYIDEVIPYQVARSSQYDLVIDITSVCLGYETNKSKAPNRIDLFARHMGVKLDNDCLPDYFLAEDEIKWAKEKLIKYAARLKNMPKIGIQARSSTVARSWPIEKVRELAIKLFNETGFQVFIFDNSSGSGHKEEWNLPGIVSFMDYGIRQVAALINEMDLLVTPDSGLMHLAGALNKRLVTIWGGTYPPSRINYYPNAVAIASSHLACWPCWYFNRDCNSEYLCIKQISVDKVLKTVIEHTVNPILKNELKLKTEEKQSFSLDEYLTKKNKILINRCSGIGDVIIVNSVVESIKNKYSDTLISIRTNYPFIFEKNKNIEDVFYGDFESSVPIAMNDNYGAIIDLNFAVEPPSICGGRAGCTDEEYMTIPRLKLMHKAAEIDIEEIPIPFFSISKKNSKKAKREIKKLSKAKTVAYVINSMSPYRTYPVNHTIDVIQDLSESYNILGIGNIDTLWGNIHPFNKIFYNAVNSIETYKDLVKCSLETKIAFMSVVDLIITPDTGMLHVAGAFGIPCIALFGNINPELRCLYYPNVYPLFANLECSKNCGDRIGSVGRKCPSYEKIESLKTRYIGAICMESIDPKLISKKARELLS